MSKRPSINTCTLLTTGGVLVFSFSANAQLSFQPAVPRAEHAVTMSVSRTFDADCRWRVKPNVRRAGNTIDVLLDLSGDKTCEGVITHMKFEVQIGSLPSGNYEVRVRWADQTEEQTTRLQVSNTPQEN